MREFVNLRGEVENLDENDPATQDRLDAGDIRPKDGDQGDAGDLAEPSGAGTDIGGMSAGGGEGDGSPASAGSDEAA